MVNGVADNIRRKSGQGAADGARLRATLRQAGPADLRRDLRLLVSRGSAWADEDPQTCEAARARVAADAGLCNGMVERWLDEWGFDAVRLSAVGLVEVLNLTSRGDPHGALRAARKLKRQIDLALLVYDFVEDKQRLFELVSDDKARAMTRLFRGRRAVSELIESLTGRPEPSV